MYDRQEDSFENKYFPSDNFIGFSVNRFSFIIKMIKRGKRYDTIILSHVNLLVIGWLIKKISPQTKIILLAHGIEIWYPLSTFKTKMLQKCDLIIAVSSFTRNKIIQVHNIPSERSVVLNNCLDPLLTIPIVQEGKSQLLLNRYCFEETDKILMTLTRLSSKEQYKGYDKVIEAVAILKHKYPHIKYIIAGSFDAQEKNRIDAITKKYDLEKSIVLPGYIEDAELEDHFYMSDLYVMPSVKEGFGIVFIEAMNYELPVIAGNRDGSSDALLNGRLGQLVNPDSIEEIARAISNVLENKQGLKPDHHLLVDNFGYETYKINLEKILTAA